MKINRGGNVMAERIYYWLFKRKRRSCKSCCIACKYYQICKVDDANQREHR